MAQAVPDKLMELCKSHAPKIAEQWYEALCKNPRTTSFTAIPKPACLRHAVAIYENLDTMFFAKNCAEAVAQYMDEASFVEDHYARGVPLEDVVYALILARRQVWLYSDLQAFYGDISDLYQGNYSLNRILLVFDYAIHHVVKKYGELAQGKAAKSSK